MRWFFILILMFSFKGFCQEADTLLPYILTLENDTEKVNQLYSNGFSLRNQNPRLSYRFALEAEKAAMISKSPKHLAKSYNLLGILFYKKGFYNKALDYHKKALAIRHTIGDVLGTAMSEQNLGNIFSELQLYYKAEKSYLKAIAAYRQCGDINRIVDCLNNIGTLKHTLKEYDTAIENYKLALQLVEENDYEAKAICLSNLGEAYLEKNDIEKAEAYNEDALKLRTMADNELESGDSYVNLAGILILKREFDRAKYYLDTAYKIAIGHRYSDLLYSTLKVHADFYEATGDFVTAYKWLKKYEGMRDQVMAKQQAESKLFDFEESENTKLNVPSGNKIESLWLLFLLASFAISIPFILIQHKR